MVLLDQVTILIKSNRNQIMITLERKCQLLNQGFYVEDMGSEYGPEFEGCFRWMNKITDEFQDGDFSYDEESAWIEADNFAQSCVQ